MTRFARWVPMQPLFFAYMALLCGVLLHALRRWRTVDLVSPAVMGFWLMMGLWHLRSTGDAVLLSSPFVAAALRSAWWSRRAVPVGFGLTVGVMVLVFTATPGAWHWQSAFMRSATSGPECVGAAIERLGISGRVWSAWDYDHWLLYRFHPTITTAWVWEYVLGEDGYARMGEDFEHGEIGPQRFVDRYGVNTAVLPTIFHMAGVGVARLEAHGWAMVHQVISSLSWHGGHPTPGP